MIFTTVLDYNLAHVMARQEDQRLRKQILMFSLICNLGLLLYFKYAGFFARTVLDATNPIVGFLNVILPAGISFYTFQTIAYMVDVYRREAAPETNFWRFAGFVSFFPHLVAGPLTRHHQLIPALERISREGISIRWREGISLFVIGLAKKVLIADRIAHFIDPLLMQPADLTFGTAWLTLLSFSLQIYFDFSAYSDMAIGLGRLFGVELPQNFNSPYQSRNPSDFWKRWHMTLSSWLRDYLYFSLGGNRKGPRRQTLNLMITMLLGGLWHGANWTFVAWGFYHGLLLVLYHRFELQWNRFPVWSQRILTFLLITFGWLFFRSPTFEAALLWLQALVGLQGFSMGYEKALKVAALVGAGLAIVNFLPNASSSQRWKDISPRWQFGLACLAIVSILFIHESSKFIYFQF